MVTGYERTASDSERDFLWMGRYPRHFAMLSHREPLVVTAPAKLNLFLEVFGKRPDGYHELATLMVTISLCDTLAVGPAPPETFTLTCNRPGLSLGPDNLICRAATLLRARTGCTAGANLHLTKRIPWAAGLAGGSSDAASTLLALNQFWGLDVPLATLQTWAGALGSDVAFFFQPPAAWCTGRGEIVTPVALGGPLWFVLVCPEVGLSTPLVFRHVTVPTTPVDGSAIRTALAAGDVESLGRCLHNRLQAPAEQLSAEVATWARVLAEVGGAGRLMSGSGSSLFVLGRDAADADRIARQVRARSATAGPADTPLVGQVMVVASGAVGDRA
jgi:4-diphosphocytidyl-2-C-methyl-D-erythritol kinase